MNKAYANQVLRLLGRIISEYEVDIDDPVRFDSAELDILQLARNEAVFYGLVRDFPRLEGKISERDKRELQGKNKGK